MLVRTAFIHTLCDLAERDSRVWLLCGDLGYSVVEPFAERFPRRFVNAGVAEQNMIGMAAGLALSGKVVCTYSIANFATLRCLEQIRNDVAYHRANVKIVAVGGGLSYANQGYTHHGVEDLAILQPLPHMTVLAPGDPVEARLATEAMVTHAGPCYLRLGRGGEPVVHTTKPAFAIGKVIPVWEGSDITIASTGAMLHLAVEAARVLAGRRVSAEVLSVPTLRPLDREGLLAAARRSRRLITVEEHGQGGLGAAAAELIAEAGLALRFKALRLPREPFEAAGSQDYLRARQGLDVEGIVTAAVALMTS
jgi:transketolase